MKETVSISEKKQTGQNPFAGVNSGYGVFDGSTFHSMYPRESQNYQFHTRAHDYFRTLVSGPAFACIAGQSVVRGNNYAFAAYPDMTSPEIAKGVCHDLWRFKQEFGLSQVPEKMKFMSFIAAFEQPQITNQLQGTTYLYTLLKQMHEYDVKKGFQWNSTVSHDIHSPEFGYSASGDGFFIPLLYPYSGSPARKSEITMVVFNAHTIFEKLKQNGAFEKLKAKIRTRQEWVHPHLGDHGAVNEFVQYALVDPDEKTQKDHEQVIFSTLGTCPFGK